MGDIINNNVSVTPAKSSRKPDNKPDNKPDGSKPEVAAWKPNGLPDNDTAVKLVAGWKADYDDAKKRWPTMSQAEKLAYAQALAKRLDSNYDGDMSDKRSLGGYIRLAYSEASFRYVRNVTCGDSTLPVGLRQWCADLSKALRDGDNATLATLKPSDGSNATYVAIGQLVQRRNMPTITVWPSGGRTSRKLAGSGEVKLD